MKVLILPSRQYINLEEDINIATFPILNTVDSVLLIKCKNNLIINANDTSCESSLKFIKMKLLKVRIPFF